jgi:hypothetical protein
MTTLALHLLFGDCNNETDGWSTPFINIACNKYKRGSLDVSIKGFSRKVFDYTGGISGNPSSVHWKTLWEGLQCIPEALIQSLSATTALFQMILFQVI